MNEREPRNWFQLYGKILLGLWIGAVVAAVLFGCGPGVEPGDIEEVRVKWSPECFGESGRIIHYFEGGIPGASVKPGQLLFIGNGRIGDTVRVLWSPRDSDRGFPTDTTRFYLGSTSIEIECD